MKHKPKRSVSVRHVLTLFIMSFCMAYSLMTYYYVFIKNTTENYSFFQTWKSYQGVADWNIFKHATTDMDGDSINDMVTFTNCAFLSSVRSDMIPANKQCKEPTMAVLAFPQDKDKVGQKITSLRPISYFILKKTYLVKTHSDEWKFYSIDGLKIHVFLLQPNKIFSEIHPTFVDRIDAWTYQLTHLGATMFLGSMNLIYTIRFH